MKNINQIKKHILAKVIGVIAIAVVVTISSCDPTIESLSYDLPEANSKADATPPSASFSASVTADYLTWTFGNTSSSATDYAWDYGDGNTSTGVDGENTYSAEGTYTVTLIASDKLGATSTFSSTVEVVEPPTPAVLPITISEWAFEDGTGEGGDTEGCVFIQSDGTPRVQSDNGTNCWRIIGATVHQTSSDGAYTIPFDDTSGKTQGAKYPVSATNARVSYQAVTAVPNTEYTVNFHYAMKKAGDKIRVAILDGQILDAADFSSTPILAQLEVNDGTGKNQYKSGSFVFESNATGEIAIWIDSENDEDCYLDNITIVPVE